MDVTNFEMQVQQLRAVGIAPDIIAALVQMYRIVRSIDQASRQPVSPEQLATLAAELYGFRSVVSDFNVESSGLRREVASMATDVSAARTASQAANTTAATALTRSTQAVAKVDGLSVQVQTGATPSGSYNPATGRFSITVTDGLSEGDREAVDAAAEAAERIADIEQANALAVGEVVMELDDGRPLMSILPDGLRMRVSTPMADEAVAKGTVDVAPGQFNSDGSIDLITLNGMPVLRLHPDGLEFVRHGD